MCHRVLRVLREKHTPPKAPLPPFALVCPMHGETGLQSESAALGVRGRNQGRVPGLEQRQQLLMSTAA